MDFSQPIERAISSYINQWLEQHPFWAWIFQHPVPSLVIFLLLLFLFWGLLKAVGRGTEQLWLFLLKTPFKILQPLFHFAWRAIGRLVNRRSKLSMMQVKNDLELTTLTISPQARMTEIVDRLQTLKQEQEILLTELRDLINSQQ
jgi:hypothetical protein